MNKPLGSDPESTSNAGPALSGSRAIENAPNFRILLADESLSFRQVDIHDPVPLGRQILLSAGLQPVVDFSLFAVLPGGDFEDIRLDETFDLRGKGAEKFIAFRSDRVFRLTVNERSVQWGKPAISGAALYALAGSPEGQAVFLDTRGGQDRLIEPDELVDLDAPGVERFITAVATYEIIVNARPRTVNHREVTYEQIVQLAFPGPHDPNVEFSITYRQAATKPPAGELGRGGVVQVKKGTIFNVTRTVQS
jgi:hypothetical protein